MSWACGAAAARAAETADGGWPGPTGPLAAGWRGAPVELRLAAGIERGLVPSFRAGDRDRGSLEFDAQWSPAPALRLGARVDALRDALPTGEVRSGVGDLRLSTLVRVVDGPLDLGVGWRVKLPNARDEGELGTDETDADLLASGALPLGPGWLGLDLGLAIRGNPLRFANQDDVPFAWLYGHAPVGPVRLGARVGGDAPTARNPARTSAALAVEAGQRLRWGAEAQLGLSAAAADWGGRLWIGAAPACRGADRD